MIKNNLTLDHFSNKLLKLMAIERNESRSAVVRELIREKAFANEGTIREYAELIMKDLG